MKTSPRLAISPLLLLSFITSLPACGPGLPAVAQVPVQEAGDWRVPAAEWKLLHDELLRCRRDLETVGRRYQAQREAFTAYNTMSGLSAVGGASTAISGVLDAAGIQNESLNKGLGIGGAVLGAAGPLIFGILSNQQNPAEARVSYEKMSAAFTAALHGRATVLHCQSLLARTPEAATATPSDAPEILAERARFTESCAAYYAVPASHGEAAPARPTDGAAAQRAAGRIIAPEYQLTKLTEQLRAQCTEGLAQAPTLLSPAAK